MQITDLPEFATGGSADIDEPSSGEKAAGWGSTDRPPASYFNWLHKLTYENFQWLKRQSRYWFMRSWGPEELPAVIDVKGLVLGEGSISVIAVGSDATNGRAFRRLASGWFQSANFLGSLNAVDRCTSGGTYEGHYLAGGANAAGVALHASSDGVSWSDVSTYFSGDSPGDQINVVLWPDSSGSGYAVVAGNNDIVARVASGPYTSWSVLSIGSGYDWLCGVSKAAGAFQDMIIAGTPTTKIIYGPPGSLNLSGDILPSIDQWAAVIYDGTQFVLFGHDGTDTEVWYGQAAGGINWTQAATIEGDLVRSATLSHYGQIVAVGDKCIHIGSVAAGFVSLRTFHPLPCEAIIQIPGAAPEDRTWIVGGDASIFDPGHSGVMVRKGIEEESA
jgi:hypothetical protein